jgi:hypothetical protein
LKMQKTAFSNHSQVGFLKKHKILNANLQF